MANYAIQKVMNIRGYNVLTDQMELTLKALKESTFTTGREETFVTKDNVKIASFDFGANAQITGASAYIQDDLMAAQVGKDTVEGATTEIRITERITITSDSGVADKTASGVAGSEVKFMYVLDNDYNHEGTVLTQAGTASATEFTYDSGSNTYITSGIADGTVVEVAFYPATSTAKKIEAITTNYTKTLRLECDMIFKDTCTDTLAYGLLVCPKSKIGGSFTLNLAEGGEPSLIDFSAEVLSDCQDNLWKMFIYQRSDMA